MDASKNTIVVATLLPDEESPVTDRIANEEVAVCRLVGRFADRSVLRAGLRPGRDYELYRLLASMGVACQVAAIADPLITVRLERRAYSPVLRRASLPPATAIPWWGNRTLHYEFT